MVNGITNTTGLENIPMIDVGTVLYIAEIIVIAYILVYVLSFLLRKISEQVGQYRIVVKTLIPLLKFLIYLGAIYFIIVAVLQPSLTETVAFSGLLGAALGFGLKDLFADAIGGITITFEKPFQIGDKITFGKYYGEVIDIGIRGTRLVTPDDNTVTVPNFLIFTESVASGNYGKLDMMVVIDLYIDPHSDANRALKILKDAIVTSKYVYISPECPYTVLLDDFPYYRRVRAKAYVNDLRQEFEFKSEVTRRAWMSYQEVGIEPPRIPLLPNAEIPGPAEPQ
jgi:small-conductance mechanosensitive channel